MRLLEASQLALRAGGRRRAAPRQAQLRRKSWVDAQRYMGRPRSGLYLTPCSRYFVIRVVAAALSSHAFSLSRSGPQCTNKVFYRGHRWVARLEGQDMMQVNLLRSR